MKRFALMLSSICAVALLVPALLVAEEKGAKPQADSDGFYSLFDGWLPRVMIAKHLTPGSHAHRGTRARAGAAPFATACP